MTRFAHIFALLPLGIACPAAAAEILVLKSSSVPAYDQAVASLQSALADRSVAVEDLRGDARRVPAAVERARGSDVAVTIAVGPLAAEAASGIDKPVVYVLVPHATSAGLRGPLVTGVHIDVGPSRQLALMRQLLPTAREVVVIYDPSRSRHVVAEAREPASRLGLKLVEIRVQSERAVPVAVRRLRGDALWLLADETVINQRSYPLILRASLSARIPAIGFSQELVRAGALAALEPDFRDSGRKAADLARSFLEGRRDVEPIHPEGRLFLNDRVVRSLGLALPASLRSKVGRVFVP